MWADCCKTLHDHTDMKSASLKVLLVNVKGEGLGKCETYTKSRYREQNIVEMSDLSKKIS